ncbi:MAG TPA: GWxTD domain-containing protein [Thermoanaerobaculia bacterium]|nr:GWxTD domain-containing protein [Thermoanaerobaculia bacterium]
MRFPKFTVAFALVLTFAAAEASAALSKKYSEWRNGPVQWIMTVDEQRAWRNLKTDQEASEFIDLFWAKRDPSPGSPENGFKDEFEARVRYSDEKYGERGRKGSMTDRGRAFIVLGAPTRGGSSTASAGSLSNASGGSPENNTGAGRALGAREVWEWDRPEALAKFDMPKVEIVFVQDPITARWTRDVTRPDFAGAVAGATRKSLVSPNLAAVPEWAAKGGLEQKVILVREVIFPAGQTAPGTQTRTQTVTTPGAPAPALPMAPRGASRFMLLREVNTINPETKADPLATLTPVGTFKASDDLGWISQYCTGSDEEPTLRFSLRMTGKAANEVIDRAAPPDEMVPDRIKSAPGCYLLRGAIPLEGMSPGNYELEVIIEDTGVYGDSHTLKQSFTIE